MTTLIATMLSKMQRGSPDYFRYLERMLEQLQRQTGTDVAVVSGVAEAARSSAYAVGNPSSFVWNSDPTTGAWPGGNPSETLTLTFYDESGTQVAQQLLDGQLTTATGFISVTNNSSSASTDYSVAYALVDDGTESVRADVTLTLPDGSNTTSSLSWNALDVSGSGGTPVTGGGK